MTGRFIYFIKPVGVDGPIKIGCSKAPESRMANLMSWSPLDLEIICRAPGDFRMEEQVHRRFSPDHIRHEWFRHSPELAAFIETVKATGTVDAIFDLPSKGSIHAAQRRASWSPERRLYMSYCLRINGAEKRLRKLGENTPWRCPDDIQAIISRWAGHGRGVLPQQPTAAEIVRMDEYLSSPVEHSVAPSWARKRAA